MGHSQQILIQWAIFVEMSSGKVSIITVSVEDGTMECEMP
jgi:hypothetical protein